MTTRHRSALLLGALLLSGEATAHGLWGHVHVTGWAVENMPDDELRRCADDGSIEQPCRPRYGLRRKETF